MIIHTGQRSAKYFPTPAKFTIYYTHCMCKWNMYPENGEGEGCWMDHEREREQEVHSWWFGLWQYVANNNNNNMVVNCFFVGGGR